MKIEKRTTVNGVLRLSPAASASGGARVRGYAATFDTVTQIGDFDEVIRRGAFRDTLNERRINIACLWNHNTDVVLGRSASGTLLVNEDDHGLAFSVALPDTQPARDLRALMARNDIHECSFAFAVRPGGERWSRGADGRQLRELTALDLFDVSLVCDPAYGGTSATLASARPRTTNALLLDLLDRDDRLFQSMLAATRRVA